MRVGAIRITDSDIRYWKIEPGYRLGWYLEHDKAAPNSTRTNLVVYRVPTGTQAPIGRISDADLLRLAQENATVAEPEPIARLPYWSFIEIEPIEVPDDTPLEPQLPLPASTRGMHGDYVEPANAFTPIAPPTPAAPVKAAKADKVADAPADVPATGG